MTLTGLPSQIVAAVDKNEPLASPPPAASPVEVTSPATGTSYAKAPARAGFEKDALRHALRIAHGNKCKAAQLLRKRLYRMRHDDRLGRDKTGTAEKLRFSGEKEPPYAYKG